MQTQKLRQIKYWLETQVQLWGPRDYPTQAHLRPLENFINRELNNPNPRKAS